MKDDTILKEQKWNWSVFSCFPHHFANF